MFPSNFKPMPLARRAEPFSSPDYFFEIKHDGFRALAYVDRGTYRLVSRNGNPFASFTDLAESICASIQCDSAVLDGEIVCLDDSGRSQFTELLHRRGEARYFAFDLLWCDGKDLRYEPLHERKRKLRSLVPPGLASLLYLDHVEARGEDLFRLICEYDLEGIVAKPRNSPYIFTESEPPWLKIRNADYSQWHGRDELFHPDLRQEMFDGWAGCALAIAGVEL